MSISSSIDRKWSCEYCTYENWPAAKKCVLCRAPKPMQFISDDVLSTEKDIYKIAPLICPDSSPVESSGKGTSIVAETNEGRWTPNVDATTKWTCHLCTYLNWPKAVRCTQCLTPRAKQSQISTRDLHTQPLNIDVNAPPDPISSSARNSPSSPEAAKATNNDRNRAVAGLSTQACAVLKWSCRACTYENWPRAVQCAMCHFPRDKGTATTFSDKEPPTNSRAVGISSSSRRRSPPISASSRSGCAENIEASHTGTGGGATASPSIYQQLDQHGSGSTIDNASAAASRSGTKLRQIRNRLRDVDWLWLMACQGVMDGDVHAVEAYLAGGGDPARQLTADECTILGRPSAFSSGFSLVHLAIRFRREDMLSTLLAASEVAASKARKRVPSYTAPDIAAAIVREIASSLRQRKGDFPCYFLMETSTFSLPADIADLPNSVKKQLFEELLDSNAQKELEDEEEHAINWSAEITEALGSRLYALWNRTAGDCLLDSVLQASWGIMDRDNTLRRALYDSLSEAALTFYERWKETEAMQAELLHFSLDEGQWEQDWAIILSIANQPGSSLEQIHIFALAHILRRPIIVYGIKYVKNYQGDNIGLARFQGVYLPLLWEPTFCWRTPLALGYTRGHFTALVPMEVDLYAHLGARANIDTNEDAPTVYLPLMDYEGKVLPVHFLLASEIGREVMLLHEWLDCFTTESGLLVAKQQLVRPPQLVRQMVEEWLHRYRSLAEMVHSAGSSVGAHLVVPPPALSSDSESDDE